MFAQMPLRRLTPWYPGQFGIDGSDNSLGARIAPRGNVLYVDASHPDAKDANDGTNTEAPKLTVQGAVNSPFLVEGSWIVVQPGTYVESVLIPATIADYCTLMGASANGFWPSIVSDAAALDAITLQARGWTIRDLRVTGHSASAGILLYEDADPGYMGAETVIDNVFFDGAWRALYGLEFNGAPGMVTVQNCRFSEHHVAGNLAYAIRETATPRQNAYECKFINNWFFENDNHVKGGFGVSLFQGNQFLTGALIPVVTDYLDLTGGTAGHNMVTGNVFEGDYSIAGGYQGNVAHPDFWGGNLSNDLAEAEVGADGWTIAPPA